jgi:molybdate transport system ATP-binding protein
VTALFGASGSGKTTLLRAIAGLEKVPGGFLQIGEEVWQDDTLFIPTHRRPLGYVFQEASLFPHLSVRGNMEYGARRVGRVSEELLHQTAEMLGIGHLMQRAPSTLSGGERQRVAIGRALLTRPKILLMDEPLASLDQARKQEVLPYLQRLHRDLKIPILYVSHSPDEVAQLADYLVVLESGNAVACGPLAETLAQVESPIRLGEEAGVVLEGMIGERDAAWHLARVDVAGRGIWTRDVGHEIGRKVRIRLLARDVSLSLEEPQGSSIINHLFCEITGIADDEHPALCLVRLEMQGSPILARMTRRSAEALGIRVGVCVWAQIKAVAVVG